MPIIASIILGIVLGITEFLPVSSLGHSLVLEAFLKFPADSDARNTLAIFIQMGAVLAVIVHYGPALLKQARFLQSDPKVRRLWINILVAFLPIGILGLLFEKQIKQYLFQPIVVALALIVGGIIFLFVEGQKHEPTTHELENITLRQAFLVGIAQITALIPGVSRSGATIIGGMLSGLDRSIATVFTFYLFIPTLGSAAGYEMFKAFKDHQVASDLLPYFVLAMVVGFVVSLLAIRVLLRYISTHNFRPFGIYRIAIGLVIIALILTKVIS